MSDDSVDLSIAIVSYNTRALLLECLASVFESTQTIRVEVIVVDNHSQDDTVAAVRAAYPALYIIMNSENKGFSKGVNQALAVSRGRYFLMLNSDTRVLEHTCERMSACLDREPTIGAVGCKQWTGEGQLYQSCFPFPSICDHLIYAAPVRQCVPALQKMVAATQAIDCTLSHDVDWINGACFMVRTDLMRACGGLDEGYFMYFEDVDLCQAIHKRGYLIRHVADADIIHLIGRSGERERTKLNLVWEFSRIRYVEKHFPLFKRWIMKTWIILGALVRLISTVGRRPSTGNAYPLEMYVSLMRRLVYGREPVPSELVWAGSQRR